MRATAGFYANNPFWRKRARAGQKLRVFLRIDIVGDNGNIVPVAHMLAKRIG